MLRIGSSFLLNPTVNKSPKPRLQEAFPCRHPYHSWDLGLGTPCEVPTSIFQIAEIARIDLK